MPTRHLAILTPPFLDLILKGTKTIESRFSRVRCAPYGRVNAGDLVLLKRSSGLVEGEFTVSHVETFGELSDSALAEIAKTYGNDLCADADPKFWEMRKGCKYATLMHVSNPVRYEQPYPFPKKDRRGWVVLDEIQ